MAYRIGLTDVDNVVRHLDHREKDGYVRTETSFFPDNNHSEWVYLKVYKIFKVYLMQMNLDWCRLQPFALLFYLATSTNEFYVGSDESEQTIAKHIATSNGPSGSDREYLFQLAAAVRNLADNRSENDVIDLDPHLFRLESLVRSLTAGKEEKYYPTVSAIINQCDE